MSRENLLSRLINVVEIVYKYKEHSIFFNSVSFSLLGNLNIDERWVSKFSHTKL